MSLLHLDPLRSTWIRKTTGELVTVDGDQCPEDCRVPDREEVCSIFEGRYVRESSVNDESV